MRCPIGFIFSALLATPSFAAATHENDHQVCDVALPNVKLGANERIVAIDLSLNHASIHQLNSLPGGWYFEIDNNSNGSATMKSNAQVGAAALNFSDIKNLLEITPANRLYGDPKVDLIIGVTVDFAHLKEVRLSSAYPGASKVTLQCHHASMRVNPNRP